MNLYIKCVYYSVSVAMEFKFFMVLQWKKRNRHILLCYCKYSDKRFCFSITSTFTEIFFELSFYSHINFAQPISVIDCNSNSKALF